METELLLKLVGNIGVPAVICLYTLFELNKNFKRLSESIDRFSSEFAHRIDKLENDLQELNIDVKVLLQRGEFHDHNQRKSADR